METKEKLKIIKDTLDKYQITKENIRELRKSKKTFLVKLIQEF